MDESQNISLVNDQFENQGRKEPNYSTHQSSELLKYKWSSESHKFEELSRSQKIDKPPIPSEEINEIINLVRSLKSKYKIELYSKLSAVTKLLVFFSLVWYLVSLILCFISTSPSAGEILADILLFLAVLAIKLALVGRVASLKAR